MSGTDPVALRPSPHVTLVIPTFDERENVRPLVDLIDAALAGLDWELVFVDDDSPDGTSEAIRQIEAQDPRVRLLHRVGRRGLSSAVLEGAAMARAPRVAVMDADLQHDPSTLRHMLELHANGVAEVVVASRFEDGATLAGLKGYRRWVTNLGIRLAQRASGIHLGDPLSGYFLAPRDLFAEAGDRVSGLGFKILLDVLMSVDRSVRLREVPTPFRPRVAGHSKLGLDVMVDYLRLLWHHARRRRTR